MLAFARSVLSRNTRLLTSPIDAYSTSSVYPPFRHLKVSTPRPGVILLTLSRPTKLNALSASLMAEMKTALDMAAVDDGVGCVVMTGEGNVFCVGSDIKELVDHTFSTAYRCDLLSRYDVVSRFPKPLVVGVNGLALGGGFELAMMADIAYANEGASFALPEIQLGTIPGAGGTQRLPRVVGKSVAMEMILAGRKLSAEEALRRRVVSKVLPNGDHLEREILNLGERIAKNDDGVEMKKSLEWRTLYRFHLV